MYVRDGDVHNNYISDSPTSPPFHSHVHVPIPQPKKKSKKKVKKKKIVLEVGKLPLCYMTSALTTRKQSVTHSRTSTLTQINRNL